MVRSRRVSRGLAAAAAAGAGALCLTFCSQSAVAHEPIRGVGADGANDPNFDPKSGKLHPRKSVDAPRSAEGIRKRLAAGIGTTSIEQGDVPGIADGQDGSTESQAHAATRSCNRREGWRHDGSTLGVADVCQVGEGPETHKDDYQGRGREHAAEEERTEAPIDPDDDRLGLRHRPSTSREINESIDSRGLSANDSSTEDTPNSHELHPAPEHDPWEGYQIVAQADPVTSWQILREVSDSRTVGYQRKTFFSLISFHATAQ